MKLYAQNFLGLERVAWEPREVSLVVGPNGSGKTSLLQAFGFLVRAWHSSASRSVDYLGGARGLRRIGAAPEDPVMVGLEVGDLRWELELSIQGGSVNEFPGERLFIGDKVALRRVPYSPTWSFDAHSVTDSVEDEPRTCLRMAVERFPDVRLQPLVNVLNRIGIYDRKWSIPHFWDSAPSRSTDRILHLSGRNLFSLFANWRTAPKHHDGKFEWVRDKARLAFHDIFDDLEVESQDDSIVARFFRPGSDEGLPMRRAADGLIVGLLHLAAVASAPEGALVAIDEMENQLHPHAIRVILQAMRERAEARDLTIVLTTHSPVLMDEFAGHLDKFFVTEPGRAETPVRLDELHDPRYLAQFALGDLYERLKFGAPRIPG